MELLISLPHVVGYYTQSFKCGDAHIRVYTGPGLKLPSPYSYCPADVSISVTLSL